MVGLGSSEGFFATAAVKLKVRWRSGMCMQVISQSSSIFLVAYTVNENTSSRGEM